MQDWGLVVLVVLVDSVWLVPAVIDILSQQQADRLHLEHPEQHLAYPFRLHFYLFWLAHLRLEFHPLCFDPVHLKRLVQTLPWVLDLKVDRQSSDLIHHRHLIVAVSGMGSVEEVILDD